MIRKFIQTLLLATLLLAPVLLPSTAHAQIFDDAKDQACAGVQLDNNAQCDTTNDTRISGILRVALNILSLVAGVATVIMVIISGMRYITSQGDSTNVSHAKSALIYALIGLVIVAIAQALVIFVVGRLNQRPAQNQSANVCIVDEDGNFVRNPDPSRDCAI